MLNFKELKEIKGDASFRKFFRNKNNRSIVVYAKKEKVKNLLIYDAVNKILNKNKILAPKLINQNYKNNYIEVEDFGDNTLYKVKTQ
jgi:aminoglycoside/choline kinase family phosphotransferase